MMLLVILCCQIGFLVQFVSSADTTPIPSADTTKTPPADTKKTSPADTTKTSPADTSQNATADTTQNAPADNSSIATADTTPKASTNSTKIEYVIFEKLFRTSRDVPIVDQESNDSPMIEEVDNPDSGYGPWGEWTKCAKHCGVGRSTRERKCNDLDNCHDGNIEVRLCSRKNCKTDKPLE
ncbi:proteoglycan 4-like [Mytilus edulis]|uniref:proteoglycan 4-like n=1 Tax=Mytilus edulis TaxID=6550 RepID=UPI0039F0C0A9